MVQCKRFWQAICALKAQTGKQRRKIKPYFNGFCGMAFSVLDIAVK
jgi:hypothetical protein